MSRKWWLVPPALLMVWIATDLTLPHQSSTFPSRRPRSRPPGDCNVAFVLRTPAGALIWPVVELLRPPVSPAVLARLSGGLVRGARRSGFPTRPQSRRVPTRASRPRGLLFPDSAIRATFPFPSKTQPGWNSPGGSFTGNACGNTLRGTWSSRSRIAIGGDLSASRKRVSRSRQGPRPRHAVARRRPGEGRSFRAGLEGNRKTFGCLLDVSR